MTTMTSPPMSRTDLHSVVRRLTGDLHRADRRFTSAVEEVSTTWSEPAFLWRIWDRRAGNTSIGFDARGMGLRREPDLTVHVDGDGWNSPQAAVGGLWVVRLVDHLPSASNRGDVVAQVLRALS